MKQESLTERLARHDEEIYDILTDKEARKKYEEWCADREEKMRQIREENKRKAA
ncbi:hypothetical protein [Neisseria yangbaofengii]|uniref:hypothetical protein n=1 Tax=Neisseria yangbaofengii TaxID=2709396 RepID=UPI0013ECB1A2|nr:hypothetical protein [Neisseria yangbaofengii]